MFQPAFSVWRAPPTVTVEAPSATPAAKLPIGSGSRPAAADSCWASPATAALTAGPVWFGDIAMLLSCR